MSPEHKEQLKRIKTLKVREDIPKDFLWGTKNSGKVLANILSLQEHIKKNNDGKLSLVYNTHIEASGLVSTYGKTLVDAVRKRDEIALKSLEYLKEKTKNLSF